MHLVGAVLNHKDQKTTAGYAYFRTEDTQKVLGRGGRKIVQIANGGLRRRASHNSMGERAIGRANAETAARPPNLA